MNWSNVLLDTNIVLYFLNGEQTLIPVLEGKNIFLSFISQLELLRSKDIEPDDVKKIRSFIEECTLIDITPGI